MTLTGPSWPFWASFLGWFWAKKFLEGLGSQIRPLFYTVWGTEYEFCLEIQKIALTGPSWQFWASFWAKKALGGLERQIRPLFHKVWGIECESYVKIIKNSFQGHFLIIRSHFEPNFGLYLAQKANSIHIGQLRPFFCPMTGMTGVKL